MVRGTKTEPDEENGCLMEVIRRRMDDLGLIQADLSRRTGIPHSTLSRILNNQKWPMVDAFHKITVALNVSKVRVVEEAEAL